MGAGGADVLYKMTKNVKSLIIFARDCSVITDKAYDVRSKDILQEIGGQLLMERLKENKRRDISYQKKMFRKDKLDNNYV